jgi:ankyrin repeat protein
MLACLVGRQSTAQKLLEHGTDINACNTRAENAIFIACYNGHVHVARLLLEHRAMSPASDQLIYTEVTMKMRESNDYSV